MAASRRYSMQRLRDSRRWSVFDPVDVPNLHDTVGAEFTAAYAAYEASGLAIRDYDIDVLWAAVVDSQRETGSPFILFQDNINGSSICHLFGVTVLTVLVACRRAAARNNEEHLGVVRSANLCTEIVQFSSPSRPAVCTLASVSLPACVADGGVFDFGRLQELVRAVVISTDRCLDVSDYPTSDVASSARATRALGVGVQELADVFMLLNLPFTSMGARELNVSIFETFYYAALDASCSLAEAHGTYPAWAGSPASRGVLQVDMWGVTPSARHDFSLLRARIARFGLRNSVITALMPTASTSKLLGNFESFEPYTRYLFRCALYLSARLCPLSLVTLL